MTMPPATAGSVYDGQRPLVSVIIAAYQQPRYLNEALRSVEQQTYRPLEIIVVDDASGEEYVRQYRLPEGARLIVHPSRQAMAATSRNTGLKVATGRYVALLDQDDLWLPEKIANQVALLEGEPSAVMTFCHFQVIDAAGDLSSDEHVWRPIEPDRIRKLIRSNRLRAPSLAMLRREALDRIGPFDATIRGSSDWDMWLRCCQAGLVLSDPRVMACCRQHDAQWSRDRVMIHQGQVKVLTKLEPWLRRERPDLLPQHAKAMARALRREAMARLAIGQGRRAAAAGLIRAFRARPVDRRTIAAVFHLLRGVARDI